MQDHLRVDPPGSDLPGALPRWHPLGPDLPDAARARTVGCAPNRAPLDRFPLSSWQKAIPITSSAWKNSSGVIFYSLAEYFDSQEPAAVIQTEGAGQPRQQHAALFQRLPAAGGLLIPEYVLGAQPVRSPGHLLIVAVHRAGGRGLVPEGRHVPADRNSRADRGRAGSQVRVRAGCHADQCRRLARPGSG